MGLRCGSVDFRPWCRGAARRRIWLEQLLEPGKRICLRKRGRAACQRQQICDCRKRGCGRLRQKPCPPRAILRSEIFRHAGHSTAPKPWKHAALLRRSGFRSHGHNPQRRTIEKALGFRAFGRNSMTRAARFVPPCGESDAATSALARVRHSTCKSSATSSLWRCVPVLAKTAFN